MSLHANHHRLTQHRRWSDRTRHLRIQPNKNNQVESIPKNVKVTCRHMILRIWSISYSSLPSLGWMQMKNLEKYLIALLRRIYSFSLIKYTKQSQVLNNFNSLNFREIIQSMYWNNHSISLSKSARIRGIVSVLNVFPLTNKL